VIEGFVVAPVALAVIGSAVSVARAARTTARVRSRLPMSAIAAAPRGRRAEHRRLAAALHDADVPLGPVEALRLGMVAVAVAALLGMVVSGPAASALAALLVAAAGPLTLVVLRDRRDRRADAGLPTVLDDVARALRAGAAPVVALDLATTGAGAPAARSEVRRVVDDVRAGLALVEALERWGQRRPTGPIRLVVGALAIGASTGGARSQAVEAVAATLRERQAVAREASALATQARSSALVIGLAPLAFAVLASLSDPRAGAFLVGTPVGLLCLGLGLALDGLGGWWMHRIVRFR
jgi:tight adherence protein B